MRARFYRENAGWLAAGGGLAFSSSFGQTFFISLFSAEIMAAHSLTDGAWGALYTAATLTSAALLVQAGRMADTRPPGALAAGICLLYAAAALTLALSSSIWLLLPAVAALRFCGQGMISHLGMTLMARWFARHRGRAVATAGLGYSLGEAMLPFLAVAAAAVLGWRGVWLGVAALLALVAAPLFLRALAQGRRPAGQAGTDETPGLHGHWHRGEVLRHWSFWVLMPGFLTPSFIGTVVFFHIAHIAEAKDWAREVMALGYTPYAAVTVAGAFAGGWMVDRAGAGRLLPVWLLPMALGVAILGLVSDVWAWFAALSLFGLTQGITIAIMGAIWAELYGTRHLGAIKALGISAMVLSTAIGPGITGLLIDAGITFPDQGLAFAVWCVAVSAAYIAVVPGFVRAP